MGCRQISATKLQTYHRCPKSYWFRYETGLKSPAFFNSAALGTALHQALADIYSNWHYLEPIPGLDWINECWEQNLDGLSPAQAEEGRGILENYYHKFIASEIALQRPLAVEGRIQGILRIKNLEFIITGRFDRLDYTESGIELIDYKSTKEIKLPHPAEIDLQMGLYYLALEQHYQHGLQKLSLVYLRQQKKIDFDASPEQKQRVKEAIAQIAIQLRTDNEWEPTPGEHCYNCAYSRYCHAVSDRPLALPETVRTTTDLQLALNL